MTITRLTLLPALIAALLLAGCGGGDSTSSDDVPDDAVAVVDGREIPRSEFDTLIEQAKRSYKSQKREFPAAGSEEYQTLRNQAVAALVQKVELEQAAEEMDIEVTDEDVDKRLEEIVKQYYGGDQKKLDKQLKAQKLTLDQVREDLRGQLVSEKIFNNVTKGAKVTDAEVKAFYESNEAQYKQLASREVRHILVKTKVLADTVRSQLTPNGSNFPALVTKYTAGHGLEEHGRQAHDLPRADRVGLRQGRVRARDEQDLRAGQDRVRLPHHPAGQRHQGRDDDAAEGRQVADPPAARADGEEPDDDRLARGSEGGLRGQGRLRGRLQPAAGGHDGNDHDRAVAWASTTRSSSSRN